MTIANGQLADANDILKHANASGYSDMVASTILTISGGVVTQVQNFHRIAGEGAADDELDTITPAADVTDGYVLFIRPSTAIVLTVKHNTGNIMCPNNVDLYLDDTHDVGILVWDANLSKWCAIAPLSRVLPGIAFIGDSTNAFMAQGHTINQGANDDEIHAWKSSDVGHGFTDITEADTYGTVRKSDATRGGVKISGFIETGNAHAVLLEGNTTADSTAKNTAAQGAVQFDARKLSGAGQGDPGSDANLVVISAGLNAKFIFDMEGQGHSTVAWTTFDAENDVALLAGLERSLLDPVAQGFGAFVDAHRERLAQLKIVTFNPDGHHFVNWTKLSMLHTGAIRQTAARLERIERVLRRIPFVGRLLLGD